LARSIGVGVIGMGWMGQAHSRSYRQITQRFPESLLEPVLVVCSDDVATRARAAQATFGFERETQDWRKVIEDPQVEIVNIATPNNLHLDIASKAAEAGKHIFCEKPVGRNPDETIAIESAARQAGVMSGVGYNYRWAPLVQYGRRLIQEGLLGKLTHYRGRFFAGYASDPAAVLSWRFQSELAGLGVLGDLMSHVIDMAHVIAGPIQRVIGMRETFVRERPLATRGEGTHFTVSTGGPTGPVSNEDYTGVLAHFANGARGTLEACRIITGAECQMAFEVHGTNGSMKWDFERMNELNLFVREGSPERRGYTRVMSGPEHPFHAHFNPAPATGLGYDDLKVIETYHFLKSIAERKLGETSFSVASAVARVQAAILRSWETEGWEHVAPN
jgi:predicted dehydrogenase